MILSRSSTGVEIGETDLTVAVVRSSFGKLQLSGIHRVLGFKDLSEDDKKKSLRDLIQRNRIPTTRIHLTLPKDQGIVRQIDLPIDLGKKVSDVVKMQVETLSPWPTGEIYWDFAAETPKKGQKLITVTIIIIPRLHLDSWVAFFKSVGMPLSGATLSSLACGHGIQVLWKEAKPTIVLHRQKAYTEGIFVSGSRIAALTASSSEDVVAPSQLLERLLSTAKLTGIEEARVIVCGDIESTAPIENPAIPIENAKSDDAKNFGPIAAALVPLKQSAFKSNLLPAELRYRESQKRLIPAAVMGALVLCMGAALFAREPYQNTVYASRLDSDIKKVIPQVKEVSEQEIELDKLAQRYKALTSQLQSHDYVLETLIELTRVLPPSTFLASYGYQDGAITISGFAPSASEIQNLLESSPLFKGAEFTTGVTRDASGKDRFTLKMVLEGPK